MTDVEFDAALTVVRWLIAAGGVSALAALVVMFCRGCDTDEPFAPAPLTRHERHARVAHHACPMRVELLAAVLLPLAALIDILTAPLRGIA